MIVWVKNAKFKPNWGKYFLKQTQIQKKQTLTNKPNTSLAGIFIAIRMGIMGDR